MSLDKSVVIPAAAAIPLNWVMFILRYISRFCSRVGSANSGTDSGADSGADSDSDDDYLELGRGCAAASRVAASRAAIRSGSAAGPTARSASAG